jgi:glyoxylase-like metal-dependent hydrolase (beta-lactamase superfamily II)
MLIKKEPILLARYAYGPMDNFQYILGDPHTQKGVFVDPGWEGTKLVAHMAELGLTPDHILLTHGHYDHVMGIPDILKVYPDLAIYISGKEHPAYLEKLPHYQPINPETLAVGNIPVSVFETPGHSPGSVCFHVGQFLFVGDTVFVDGCGRTDLHGGNARELYQSLQTLRQFPPDMVILSGHDYGHSPMVTLAELIEKNWVFSERARAHFLGSV